MKSRNDPRHQHREHLMQLMFTWEYRQTEPADLDILPIVLHKTEIDQRIQEAAPQWELLKIAKVDLAILRLAVWELYYSGQKTPQKVVIDEAIELGKEYGGDSSGAFINGAMGAILKKYPIIDEESTSPTE